MLSAAATCRLRSLSSGTVFAKARPALGKPAQTLEIEALGIQRDDWIEDSEMPQEPAKIAALLTYRTMRRNIAKRPQNPPERRSNAGSIYAAAAR
jgi:hypothetical protein